MTETIAATLNSLVGLVWSWPVVIHCLDLTLGLMVVPGLLAALLLSGKLCEETTVYFDKLKGPAALTSSDW